MKTTLYQQSLVTRIEDAIKEAIIEAELGRFNLEVNVPEDKDNTYLFEISGEIDEDGEVSIENCQQYKYDREGEASECNLNISLRQVEREASEILIEEVIREREIEETEWWLGHCGRDSF